MVSRLSNVEIPHAPASGGLARLVRGAGAAVGAVAWEVALPLAAQYAAEWITEKFYLEPAERRNFRAALEGASPTALQWISNNRALIEQARREGSNGEVYVHVRFDVVHHDPITFDDDGHRQVNRAPGEYHLREDGFAFGARPVNAVEERAMLVEDVGMAFQIRREEVVVSIPIDPPADGSLESASGGAGWPETGSGEGRIGLEHMPRQTNVEGLPSASGPSQKADMVFTREEVASDEAAAQASRTHAPDMVFSRDEVMVAEPKQSHLADMTFTSEELDAANPKHSAGPGKDDEAPSSYTEAHGHRLGGRPSEADESGVRAKSAVGEGIAADGSKDLAHQHKPWDGGGYAFSSDDAGGYSSTADKGHEFTTKVHHDSHNSGQEFSNQDHHHKGHEFSDKEHNGEVDEGRELSADTFPSSEESEQHHHKDRHEKHHNNELYEAMESGSAQ
jgi:hypothetical protein